MKYLNFINWYKGWFNSNKILIFINIYGSYFFLISNLKGIIYWLLYALDLFLLLFCLIKFFLSLKRNIILCKLIKKSPITIINAPLGNGKTLLATYLSQLYKIDNCFSNYAINDYRSKMIGINNLDFTKIDIFFDKELKKKIPSNVIDLSQIDSNPDRYALVDYGKPLPDDNSLILLDEIYLYFSGNDPKSTKEKHRGTIVTYLLARQFDYNFIFIGQRIGQHWIEYREIANLIIQCLDIKYSFIERKFKLRLGFFQDMDDYVVWKTEKAKLSANGKKKRTRSNAEIGMTILKIEIPLSVAKLYDSKYLKSVKRFKNDFVKNSNFNTWSDFVKKRITEEDLQELGMNNLYENLFPNKKGRD